MRPVIPSLATLAWGEARRRGYWESELINALTIIQNGWSTAAEMNGSWAGAMGHTQWMPEVWLHLGVDYDGDGKISPFGRPDDALATTARYFVERGNYRRGEAWGHEVRAPEKAGGKKSRRYAEWQKLGVLRADGQAFPLPEATAKLWVPVPGGPAFLLGPNFYAVHTYNPSMNYTLAIVHLGDRCIGAEPLVRSFPGSEPPPTLAEVQEIQRRLTALGFDTGGADGRVGNGTMLAVQAYQRKAGVNPADGYAGIKSLARLRREPRSGSIPPRHDRNKTKTGKSRKAPMSPPHPAAARAAPTGPKAPTLRPPTRRSADRATERSRRQRAGLRQRRGRRHAARARHPLYRGQRRARAIAACTTALSIISATSTPQMLLCVHEESAVAIAHG